MAAVHRESSAASIAVIVTLLLLLFVGTLAGLGVTAYVYMSRQQARLVAMREQAMAAEHLARVQADEARARAEAMRREEEAAADSGRTEPAADLQLRVDGQGKLHLAGQTVEREAWNERLGGLLAERESAPVLVVQADANCPLVDLTALLEVCRQAGISDVRLELSQRAEDPREGRAPSRP